MKAARRLEAKSRKSPSSGGADSGEDPDIAGIVPGPQRNPWSDMGAPETELPEADDETQEDKSE